MARKFISMGAKWRVGDEKLIRIFKDSWLPETNGGKITSSPTALGSEARVDNLIEQNLGQWNEQVINSCFIPFEAQQIKAIPLVVSPESDFLYWSLEKDGVYSVKSGYKAICEDARRGEASVSNSAAASGIWSAIWKLNVPGKIKHFLWRACTNSLPTKTNLLRRKVISESLCHRYGYEACFMGL